MTPQQEVAYDLAINKIGSISAAARHLGYKTAWGLARHGKCVPDGKVLEFAALADWVSTPHDLRPDLYPHPDDGLPQELRDGRLAPVEATAIAGGAQ